MAQPGPPLQPPGRALGDLEAFSVSATVVGPEVAMLVTEGEIVQAMREALGQGDVFVDEVPEEDSAGGWLHLTLEAYAVEPWVPEDAGQGLRIYPISIELSAGRSLYLAPEPAAPAVAAQVWTTHVAAWALEGSVREIACLAVRKALTRFMNAYRSAALGGGSAEAVRSD